MFELFTVVDTYTGKTYNQPMKLINNCNIISEHDYYFNQSSFAINTIGELIIMGRMDKIIWLDNKRFKPIFSLGEIVTNYETWREVLE